METAERRAGLKTLLMIILASMLGYAAYLQQQSPLCRALSGQPVNQGNSADIAFYSTDKGLEFAIAVKKGRTEIRHPAAADENNYYKRVAMKSIPNFASAPKNPNSFFEAACVFFNSETDLTNIEKTVLMQAVLREGMHETLKTDVFPVKMPVKRLAGRTYSVEIMNASGQPDLTCSVAAWLEEHGFRPVPVSGALARQEKTEIFAYGGRSAAEEIKSLACANGSAEICRISVFDKKNSVNAAIVIGSDYKKIFSETRFSLKKDSEKVNTTESKNTAAKKTDFNKKTSKNTQKRGSLQKKGIKNRQNVSKSAKKR